MKYTYRILCAGVFALGLIAFSGSQSSVSHTAQNFYKDIEPALPFVVTFVESRVKPDGSQVLTGWRTRYVKASGEWRDVLHGLKGNNGSSESGNSTQDIVHAGLPGGVVVKEPGSNELKSVSSSAVANKRKLELFRSHEYLKNDPGFVRIEVIAGLEAYVNRYAINNNDSPIEWVEKSYSPRTGLTPLRTVRRFKDGSEMRIEAISVVFKDVPEDLNDDLKAMPKTGKSGDQSPSNK